MTKNERLKGNFRSALVALLSSAAAVANVARAQSLVPVNLYIADLTYRDGSIQVGPPRKLTGDRGIASQPSFTPDGKAILYVSRRDSANAQSDIYRIDLGSLSESRITSTPEMENSPTVTPDGMLMVIRWTPPTLFREWGPWLYDMKGRPVRGVLPGPDTVGYYVRVDDTRFAMVRPKSRTTIALFDSRSGAMTDYDAPVANLPPQLMPEDNAVSYARPDSAGHNQIRRLDLRTFDTSVVISSVVGRVAHAWARRGFVLMGKGNAVYAARPAADRVWKQVAAFSDPQLQSITTYVVSPKGDKIVMISPVKPALQGILRDSIQSGATLSTLLAEYSRMPISQLTSQYDVSEGGMVVIAAEQTAKGHAADAVALLRITTGIFPKSYLPQLALGDAFQKLGERSHAVDAYRASLTLNPQVTASEKRDAERARLAIADAPLK